MLLELLRVGPTPRSGGGDVDWDALLAFAGTSLAPLLLHGMGARAAEIAPPPVLATLRERRRRLAVLGLRQAAVLRQACAALDAAAVPFIVVKGAALARLVYPDPLLRPMSDIDLWVDPQRVDDARRSLASAGFRDIADNALANAVALDGKAGRLVAEGSGVEVELHARLASLAGVSWARFDVAWPECVEADLGGFRARVLAPERQLTHVCLHLARKNAFASGLIHLGDVARIVGHRDGAWDWPGLERAWRSDGAAAWVVLAVVLARDLLGASVPASLAPCPDAAVERAMREIAEEQLWSGRLRPLPPAVARAVRSGSASGTLRWIRTRFFDHYWRSPEHRSPVRVAVDGLRRIAHDLRVKLPAYLREWLPAATRRGGLGEAMASVRRHQALERLVARAAGVGRPSSAGARPDDRADVATGPERR